jgi:hypothetical protein
MARIRTIKPEFPQSESMGNVSREARLCFIMLWTIADDSGRLRGASRMLASLLFPYDDDAPSLIDGWLTELSEQGCIVRYEVAGAQYIEIANWLEHQKIDRPSASKIPAIDEGSRIVAKPREPSCEDLRTKDQGPKDASREFEEFWKAYPKRADRRHAERAYRSALKRASHGEILQGLKGYAFSPDPKFIPLAATWLNGDRWRDERPPDKPSDGGFQLRPLGVGG